jgi:hypothetical protein
MGTWESGSGFWYICIGANEDVEIERVKSISNQRFWGKKRRREE